jgi:hypothetical protein
MSVEVPAEAYAAFARGEISKDELLGLEKFASDLNKSAASPSAMFSPAGAAALGGLAVAAPTLAYAGSKVPQAIQGTLGAMTFNRDLKRVVEVNPQLGDPDDPNLRMAFKTLRSVNPEYSKDPLIAGTVLDMVMTNRMDPDDPSSAPRFDPALLQSIQNKGKTPMDMAAEQGAKATTGSLVGMLGGD